MTKRAWSILSLFFVFTCVNAQPTNEAIVRVLDEINDLRAQGCVCGGRWMPPVGRVSWDVDLYKVSNSYARYMARHRHFDHISKSGEDLGDRLNKVDYEWLTIGENLAHGYHDFYEVLDAWKESPDHCKMLMHPDMNKMGLSKHSTYWVQSFSGVPKDFLSDSP